MLRACMSIIGMYLTLSAWMRLKHRSMLLWFMSLTMDFCIRICIIFELIPEYGLIWNMGVTMGSVLSCLSVYFIWRAFMDYMPK